MGTARAQTSLHGTAPAFTSASALVAPIVGLPESADVAPILAGNSNISAAFGPTPFDLRLGDLGGAHDSRGHGSETIDSHRSVD